MWFLVIKVPSPEIDTVLGTTNARLGHARSLRKAMNLVVPAAIFLKEDDLQAMQRTEIPYSTVTMAYREQGRNLLLEHLECQPGMDLSTFAQNIRTHAVKLMRSGPRTIHLLLGNICRVLSEGRGKGQELERTNHTARTSRLAEYATTRLRELKSTEEGADRGCLCFRYD